MKTFTKSVAAVAVVLTGSVAFGQSGYYSQHGYSARPAADFGACPDGRCGTAAGCTTGDCGPAGCPDGNCGVSHVHHNYGGYGQVTRNQTPRVSQLRTTGYRPMPTAGYATPACPTGNCPQVPASAYQTQYRVPAATANCPNGRCPVPNASQYQVQRTPAFNFLGMRF